jgi:hypothetical protein
MEKSIEEYKQKSEYKLRSLLFNKNLSREIRKEAGLELIKLYSFPSYAFIDGLGELISLESERKLKSLLTNSKVPKEVRKKVGLELIKFYSTLPSFYAICKLEEIIANKRVLKDVREN